MSVGNALSQEVLRCCYEVHGRLGPGLLESVYEECLCHELAFHGLPFERQRWLPIEYRNVRMSAGFRLDVVVAGALLLELKAVDRLLDVHTAQVLTYLKLTGLRVGLLINFNVSSLKNGIRRLEWRGAGPMTTDPIPPMTFPQKAP